MSTKKVVVGVLAGLAAGAALGILFAPEKGSRTRRTILRKGEDLYDTLNDKIDERFDDLLDSLNRKTKKEKGQSENKSDQSVTA